MSEMKNVKNHVVNDSGAEISPSRSIKVLFLDKCSNFTEFFSPYFVSLYKALYMKGLPELCSGKEAISLQRLSTLFWFDRLFYIYSQ